MDKLEIYNKKLMIKFTGWWRGRTTLDGRGVPDEDAASAAGGGLGWPTTAAIDVSTLR